MSSSSTNLCHRRDRPRPGQESWAEGTASEIHADPRVLEAYLGMTPEMAEAEDAGRRMTAPALELVSVTGGLR